MSKCPTCGLWLGNKDPKNWGCGLSDELMKIRTLEWIAGGGRTGECVYWHPAGTILVLEELSVKSR